MTDKDKDTDTDAQKDKADRKDTKGPSSQGPTPEYLNEAQSGEEGDHASTDAGQSSEDKFDNTEEESSFNRAMKELGESMSELASARSADALNSAIPLIKDAAERIRSQARGRPTATLEEQMDNSYAGSAEEHFASEQEFADSLREHDAAQLYLDHHKRIAGVCAALARYFAMDTFTVRMLAVTGLIFIPQVAFPAYWICYFMLDKRDDRLGSGDLSRRQRRKQRKRERRAMRGLAQASRNAGLLGNQGFGWSKAQLKKMRRMSSRGYRLPSSWLNWQGMQSADESTDADSAGAKGGESRTEQAGRRGGAGARSRATNVAPEVTLRKTRFQSKELETRLRRLESFVTSKQFYLHKELSKLEL